MAVELRPTASCSGAASLLIGVLRYEDARGLRNPAAGLGRDARDPPVGEPAGRAGARAGARGRASTAERVTVDFPALDGETSAEQLLAACVAGEWADRGDVESCRLVEVEWPDGLPGPAFPCAARRLGRRDRQAGARAERRGGGGGRRRARGRRRRSRQGRRAAAVVAGTRARRERRDPGARPLRGERDRHRRRRDRRGRSAGADGQRVPRRARLDRTAARVRAADLRPPRRLGVPAPRRRRCRSRRASSPS